jgi:hydroxypyruvate isomerase
MKDRFQILKDCGFQGVEIDCPTRTSTDEILEAQEKTGIKGPRAGGFQALVAVPQRAG